MNLHFLFVGVLISANALVVPAAEIRSVIASTVSERSLNEQVWNNVTSELDESGRTIIRTNRFIEVASFLNRFDQNIGQYVPAAEGVEIINGFGVSRNTAYKAIFSGNQNAEEGAVDILMPDGQRMVLQCIGLAYYEPETGDTVWIAEAKDSIGIVDGKTVTWKDAFDDVRASIRVEARLDAVEHDVLIEEQLPHPALYGLHGKVRLQIWHQILHVPQAAVGFAQRARKDGINDSDMQVNFGTMALDRGMAFPVDAGTWGMGGENRANGEGALPVTKEWARIQGFDWLIETLPLAEAWPKLQELPAPAVAQKVDLQLLKEKMLARKKGERSKPVSIAKTEQSVKKQRLLASMQPGSYKPDRGYLVDYITRSTGVSNHRWQGDTVYYVSAAITCSGTNTVFEAGTVLKYAPNASVTINSALSWEATPYRPIIMTAKDDNSVGEIISGSSGNPMTNYYANPALYISTVNTKLHNFRISHAEKGIFYYDHSAGSGNGITHAQFVRCNKATQFNGYGSTFQNFHARNVLMTDCVTAFYGYSFNGAVEHLTLSGSTRLAEDYNGQTYGTTSSLYVTNGVFANVANSYGSRFVTVGGDRNGFFTTPNAFGANQLSSSSHPLQTVHAGAGYLSARSGFRNAGTSIVTPSLKSDIAKRTTFPPVSLTSDFTTTTALAPSVPRGGNSLGYHYDPIDFLWTSLTVTNNSTLQLTNGVAVASYGPKLVTLSGTSDILSGGNPTALNRLVTYHTVQEQPGVWITNSSHTLVDGSRVNLRFTDVSMMAGSLAARRLVSGTSFGNSISVRDSQLRGVYWYVYHYTGSAMTPSIHLTNNLLERCDLTWSQGDESQQPMSPNYLAITWRNNLFENCLLTLNYYSSYYGAWDIFDNLFDNCSITTNHVGGVLTGAGYNGFVATANTLGGSNNKTSLLRDFVSGPLGPYYFPSNSTSNSLSTLRDSGSKTNAGQVGLYHFATTRDQLKDGSSVLDIGMHYPALQKVRFVGLDTSTKGDWKGKYGAEGYLIVQNATNMPAYAGFSTTGVNEYVWDSGPSDSRALLRAATGRIAACWYSGGGGSYDVVITQNDGLPHRISVYCLDWDTTVRHQKIEILDSASGVVYDRRTVKGFDGGQYYTWDIVGNVTVRVTNTGPSNAVIGGIFFDEGTITIADYDGDASADYREDSNGNGIADGGETDWLEYESIARLLTNPAIDVYTPLN